MDGVLQEHAICGEARKMLRIVITSLGQVMAQMLDHDNRVREFKEDLVSLDLRGIVRKHITTGAPAEISNSDYYTLRQIVGDQFEVHPSAIVLVGSCRTGFSLKPEQRYHPARPGSDLDIAIISPERFDEYWDKAFRY